jgi:hypothetical protein
VSNAPTLHDKIESKYVEKGWCKYGVKKWLREESPLCDYDLEYVMQAFKGTKPDLWKISDQNSYVCLDIGEVVCSHDLNDKKLNQYYNIWFAFDSSDNMVMRLFRIDDTGSPTLLMGETPFEDKIYGRRAFLKMLEDTAGYHAEEKEPEVVDGTVAWLNACFFSGRSELPWQKHSVAENHT